MAAVTGVLVAHDANIEDSSMTILRGRFAMVLVVDLPEGADPGALGSDLAAVTAELGLVAHVEPLGEQAASEQAGAPWRLSVYGADRPGIVHRVARTVADAGANVTDLTSRVVGEPERPVYVMLLALTLPPGLDLEALRAELARAEADLGIECNLHPAEPDIL